MKLLTEKRIDLYTKALIIVYLVLIVVFLMHTYGAEGRFCDFVEYRAAGILAAEGESPKVYDRIALRNLERQLAEENSVELRFSYPPTYLLFLVPLSWLPNELAFLIFVIAPLYVFYRICQKIVPHPLAGQIALAFPGVILNISYGQNGLMSTALLGSGLLLLESNPYSASILMALLCYKPNIALVCPLLLLFSRRFKAFAVFTATVLGTVAISILFSGYKTWEAFLVNLSSVFEAVKESPEILYRIGTPYSALRLAGVDNVLSLKIQVGLMVGFIVLLGWVWHFYKEKPMTKAVTICIAMLMTPYLFEYDLALTGLAIAWFICGSQNSDLTHYEKSILIFCWLTPFINRHIALSSNIVTAPIGITALLIIAMRRLTSLTPLHAEKTEHAENTEYTL